MWLEVWKESHRKDRITSATLLGFQAGLVLSSWLIQGIYSSPPRQVYAITSDEVLACRHSKNKEEQVEDRAFNTNILLAFRRLWTAQQHTHRAITIASSRHELASHNLAWKDGLRTTAVRFFFTVARQTCTGILTKYLHVHLFACSFQIQLETSHSKR